MIPSRKRSSLSEANAVPRQTGASWQRAADLVGEPAIRAAKGMWRWFSALYLPDEARQGNDKNPPNEADQIRLHGLGVRW